jgi:hypothetical protein
VLVVIAAADPATTAVLEQRPSEASDLVPNPVAPRVTRRDHQQRPRALCKCAQSSIGTLSEAGPALRILSGSITRRRIDR